MKPKKQIKQRSLNRHLSLTLEDNHIVIHSAKKIRKSQRRSKSIWSNRLSVFTESDRLAFQKIKIANDPDALSRELDDHFRKLRQRSK